jgi:hypothetical protein
MEIFIEDSALHMDIQGNRSQPYQLSHYHFNVFSWILSQDQNAHRGRFPIADPKFYLLKFQGDGEHIENLVWSHDPDLLEGETFDRRRRGAARSAVVKPRRPASRRIRYHISVLSAVEW